MKCRIAAAVLALTGIQLSAQTPADSGRVPAISGSNSGASRFDDNRIPVLQGAGQGAIGGIQSFPDVPGQDTVQPFQPPRPQLSPYLNLIRGNTAGFSAVDYYNFVRPAQQAVGAFAGRPLGSAPPFGGGGRFGLTVDPDTGLASTARPTGAPGVFMNYGSYFNRLGTIGPGAGTATAPAGTTTRRR